MLRALVKRSLRAAGVSVHRHDPYRCLEDFLVLLFDELRINVVIDVGANGGQYGRLLRDLGYTGRIVSFEPVRATFEALQRSIAGDRDWCALNMALGERSGELEMQVPDGTIFASLLKPDLDTVPELMPESRVTRSVERVQVRRLDDVLPSCLDGVAEPRLYLKLDTQGYDLQVLAGAPIAARQALGMQSEISMQPLYQGMPDCAESLNAIRALGFKVAGMYPLARTTGHAVVEFDCVAVR